MSQMRDWSVKNKMGNLTNWTLGKKMFMGFSAVLLILLVVGATALVQLKSVGDSFNRLANHAMPMAEGGIFIELRVAEQTSALAMYLRDPIEKYKTNFEKAKKELIHEEEDLKKLIDNEKDKKALALVMEEIEELERLGEEAMELELEMEEHYHNIDRDVNEAFHILEEEVQKHVPDYQGNKLKYQAVSLHMESDLKGLMYALTEYILHGKKQSKSEFIAYEEDLDRLEEEFKHLALTGQEKLWTKKLEDYFTDIKKEGKLLLDNYEKSHKDFNEYLEMGHEVEATIERDMPKVESDVEKVSSAVATANMLIIVLMIVGLIVGIGLAVLITRMITTPVAALTERAQRIQRGQLDDEALLVTSSDELGTLARTFNAMSDNIRNILTNVESSATSLSSASEELSANSTQMSGNAEETSTQATSVSSAAEQVSANVQSVASGSDQMTASIQEIAKSANEAARVTAETVTMAEDTNKAVGALGDSSQKIGQVIKVITSIAEQTNLLALNATIEAARAGDAGKGFAVVANEVKELATQTAKATEDIGNLIQDIQDKTVNSVNAIAKITESIHNINEIANTIAASVEEQSATTSEIARSIAEASSGTESISKNIVGMASAAQETSKGAGSTQEAAGGLASMATELNAVVNDFKNNGNGNGRQH